MIEGKAKLKGEGGLRYLSTVLMHINYKVVIHKVYEIELYIRALKFWEQKPELYHPGDTNSVER